MRWPLAMVAFGVVLAVYGCAKADWQVHMQVDGVWVPAATKRGHMAKSFADDERFKCEWSLVEISYGVPSGTPLQCRRTPRPVARPSR